MQDVEKRWYCFNGVIADATVESSTDLAAVQTGLSTPTDLNIIPLYATYTCPSVTGFVDGPFLSIRKGDIIICPSTKMINFNADRTVQMVNAGSGARVITDGNSMVVRVDTAADVDSMTNIQVTLFCWIL